MLRQHQATRMQHTPTFKRAEMQDLTVEDILTSPEYIRAMRKESKTDMTVARYMVAADCFVIAFVLFSLIIMYWDHGFVTYSLLKFTVISVISMAVHGIFTWRNATRFYAKYHAQ